MSRLKGAEQVGYGRDPVQDSMSVLGAVRKRVITARELAAETCSYSECQESDLGAQAVGKDLPYP
jgi:hypothetical protein